jgi:hypothetical protein
MLETRPNVFYTKMTEIIKKRIEPHICCPGNEYGNPIDVRIRYDSDNFTVSIYVNLFDCVIYDQSFDARNITSMKLFSEKLGDEIGKHAKAISALNKKAYDSFLSITPTNTPIKFTDIVVGKCKYANLGYVRYAYLGFALRYIHVPWVKVYFDRTNILYDKTFEQLARERKSQSNGDLNTPPSVTWLPEDMEKYAKVYMKENESKIFNAVSALPLNKTGVREDQCFEAVIVVREGDDLKNVEDLSDPDLDLYILMFIDDNLHRKYHGYCRSFSGNKIFSVISQNTSYKATYSHTIGDTMIYERKSKVSELIDQDEFISSIMDQLVKNWKEKMDAKST